MRHKQRLSSDGVLTPLERQVCAAPAGTSAPESRMQSLHTLNQHRGDILNQTKKVVSVALLIGVASEFYINFYITDFNFSFAAVIFSVFLYLHDEINPIYFGVASSISCFIIRLIEGREIIDIYPEVTFYLLYGLIFYISNKIKKEKTIKELLFLFFISDSLGNMLEVYLRIGSEFFTTNLFVFRGIMIAALIRATIAILIILAQKRYRMFLIRQEHEERYKKLLWFTSSLKTEIYWMEKNMIHIENVMTNAYQLFTKISEKEDQDTWENQALDIARNIHEIKKEYYVVVRGIETILNHRMVDSGMNFYELIQIIKESMDIQIEGINKEINLQFIYQENFYTEHHYYLMSIFRNLITNAIEAIPKHGEIKFTHKRIEEYHYFKIEDNGCGISEEDKPHIFNSGFSSKIDYKTGEINRGLGLSLVNNIVIDQLKGKIIVDSKEGIGTCFEVYIPIYQLEGGKNENIFVR